MPQADLSVREASEKLRRGELVVFPTETVYGLGALMKDERAVQKIFDVKGRPSKNPLIVHIADTAQLKNLTKMVSPSAKKLIDRFWPGPLTICFEKSEQVPDIVTAGLPTVCARMPDHELAQQLLKEVGEPVAAPSANLSGRPSTTTFEDAKRQLAEKGVNFLDGGSTPLGIESTVVDCSREMVRLLRPGAVSQKEIEIVLGEAIIDESSGEKITSPGQLLEHYAPQGSLTVLLGAHAERRNWLAHEHLSVSGTALGIVGIETELHGIRTYQLCEKEDDLEVYAAHLYTFLNWCDQVNAQKIVLELPNIDHPLLPALLNRLEKASRGHILIL